MSETSKYTLTVDALPSTAYDQTIDLESADDSIATVDENGVVTAVSNGYTTITATHDALTVTCVVVVTDILYNYNLASGSTMTISATDYTSGSATWTSSDTAVATINDGLVTAVSQGYAEITVTVDGTSQTVGVVVYDQAVTSVVLSRHTASLIVDEVLQFQAIVSPDDAADSAVTWSSSDTDIATVSTSGVVTAVSTGTATITATSGGQSDSCTITIMPITNADLSSLSLSTGSLTFSSAITDYYLTVGSDVTSIDLTASADDAKAVMILDGEILSQNGTKSIPLDVGDNTVEIMVIAQDASTKTYTIKVTRQEEIAITNTSLSIGIVGGAYSVTMAAEGGTESFIWSAEGLPDNLSFDSSTGVLSGTPELTDVGTYNVTITATDENAVTGSETYTLVIHEGCGGGAYLIVSDGDAAYTGSYTADGIPTLTVNDGVSGFTYFGVDISAVTGHAGKEICVFVHTRNGTQIGFSFNRADYDTTDYSGAAFNVQAGDVILVYIVDELSNNSGSAPAVL
jgi:uncharacterized protein YjdB